ncbi:MAG: guanylate kinase [Deltaproteobacteria bacterium]|nr:guanylate kinase [Deltaproteobacteria bacterium]
MVSGPSGVGKSSVIRGALKRLERLQLSVSFTTRPPRTGEEDGKDYFFVDPLTFNRMLANNEFLEWAKVYNNYYGTSKSHIQSLLSQGHHALLDVDTHGAVNIKAISSGGVFIFIAPPSLKELEHRLIQRGSESADSLHTRLSRAEHEMSLMHEYNHVLVNTDLTHAIDAFEQIVQEEYTRNIPFHCDDFDSPDLEEPLLDDLSLRVIHNLQPAITGDLKRELTQVFSFQLETSLGNILRDSLETAARKPKQPPHN